GDSLRPRRNQTRTSTRDWPESCATAWAGEFSSFLHESKARAIGRKPKADHLLAGRLPDGAKVGNSQLRRGRERIRSANRVSLTLRVCFLRVNSGAVGICLTEKG